MKRVLVLAAIVGAVLVGSTAPSEAYYYRRYYGPVFRPYYRPLVVVPPVVLVRPRPVFVPRVVVVRPAPVVVVPY